MKNLRKKIEGMTDSYWNIIDFEDRKQLNTEIEALIMPLVEALEECASYASLSAIELEKGFPDLNSIYSKMMSSSLVTAKALKEIEE